MSATTYHHPQRAKRGDRDFVMSRTELRAFANNPHGWIQGELEVKPSGAMLFGSLVDAMLLDPSALAQFAARPTTYVDSKGATKPWNGNSNTCKDWLKRAAAEGKQVVSEYAYKQAEKAARLARENSVFGVMLSGAQTQVVLEWSYLDAETGIEVPLKAMVDLVPVHGGALVDLKTAAAGDRRSFTIEIEKRKYYYQAGFYLWGWRECKDSERNLFAWHVIETGGCDKSSVPDKKSFTQGTYVCPEKYAADGLREAEADLRKYARCLADGKWPQFTEKGPELIDLPYRLRKEAA